MHKRNGSSRAAAKRAWIWVAVVPLLIIACRPPSEIKATLAAKKSVVLYTSVDEKFARSVIQTYQRETGEEVQLVTDSEAGKTTGLVNRIRAEKSHPRANVFWSSERSQTILLAREGLFASYDSASAVDIPRQFHDAKNRWTGFAQRIRVLAFDPSQVDQDDIPADWADLAKPEIASHLAIANPLFGTTRAHMGALLAEWGKERFEAYLQSLVKHGVLITDGNSSALRRLIEGEVRFAMTDSDDVFVARRRGHKVGMLIPILNTADPDAWGALVMPNTVALIAGSEDHQGAKRLIDYILSSEVERMLAKSDSGNYPVRKMLRDQLDLQVPQACSISSDAIANAMPEAIRICRETLLR